MIPAVPTDPQLQVRSLIARYFFGTTALVSLGLALAFSLHAGLDPVRRAALVGALVALAAVSAGASRVGAASLHRALLSVLLASTGMVGVGAALLGWGLNGLALGLLGLLACMACAVSTVRLGATVAAAGTLILFALALGEHRGWLGGAQAMAGVPLGLRLLLQLIVLGAGLASGWLISRVVNHYLQTGREREQRFLTLLGIAADAYWELDERYRLVFVSRRGRSRSFEPRPLGARLPPWELPQVRFDDDTLDAMRADLEARRPLRDVSLRWQEPGGALHHLQVSGEPRYDARDQFIGYWGVTRDVTADVKARQALIATEMRHRELFARIPSPLVLHRNGRIVDANPAAVALFGYADLPSMIGADLLAHYGAERAAAEARIGQLAALPRGRGLPIAEYRLRARGGREVTVRASGVRVDADGGPAVLSIYLDDTERKAAEDAVRRSEALLSHLFATSPDVITLTELDSGRYAMVNDTFTQLTRYRADEVIGRTSVELGIWGRAGDRERLIAEIGARGAVRDLPTEFVGKHGQRLSMLVSAARFVMDGRDYLVINARDVSADQRARLEREAILDNASIGIALTRDQRFQLANPAFEQMFGWPAGALVGRPGRAVWPSEDAYARFGHDVGPALGRGEQIEIECTMVRHDGSEFLCRLLARAVDPSHPSRGGTIWIAEDVTERRQVEAALERARDDAEAASRAKSAFLANTSHEIRTPLNGLVGLARLARQPDIAEPRRRQYLEQIHDSAETLAAIISDILDLSKIEAGKLHIEAVPFGLHALLETLHRGYRSIADARALGLDLEIDPRLPATVLGDPVRVRQIVSNYVTNALKFTPRGGVRIAAQAGPGETIRFEVHDSGPGIDRATQARLFQPFTQADQSTTRRFGGTGLGLSICHQLAALMGGRVGVHSEPGTGSCFWAELPLPATEARASNSAFSPLDGNPLAGAHVLMVEDNPVNMMIAVALLEQWGARVVQASNGVQAVEAVEQAAREGRPFDAVLMDVQMPLMSGHEATRILRRRHDCRALPIVALTAAALVSEREAALAAGMNDFLTKPIDAQRLHTTLTRVLAATA